MENNAAENLLAAFAHFFPNARTIGSFVGGDLVEGTGELIQRSGIDAQLIIYVHDEVHYLVPEDSNVDAFREDFGKAMMSVDEYLDVPLVFAGLLILAVMGLGLYVIFSLIEMRVTGWARRKELTVA